MDVLDPKEVTAMDPSWTQVEPLDQNTGCKIVDATGSDKNINEIKETPQAEKTPMSDDELIAQGISEATRQTTSKLGGR